MRSLAVALAVSIFGVLPAILTGTLAVQIKADLQVSDTALGGGFSAFFIAGGLTSIWAGRLVGRSGWRRSVRIAAGISSVAVLGVATLAHTYWTLLGLLVVAGIGHAFVMPTSNLIISQEIPRRRHGLIFGVKQASLPVASLFAGLSVPIIGLTVGWRWAFGIALVFPLVAVLSIPPPSLSSARERGEPAPGPGKVGRVVSRGLTTITLGGLAGGMAVSALATFLVLSAVDAGLSEGAAGVLVATSSVLGLVVRVGAGWLADEYESAGFAPVAALLGLGSIGLAVIAIHRPSLVIVGTIVAYATAWGWPGLYQFGVVNVHPDHAAEATGFTQVGLASGSALGPVLFGLLVHVSGFSLAWTVFAVVAAVAALLVGAGGRTLAAGRS